MQVYGVDITVPQKLLALVDESGYTVADLPITYTILPADYQAVTAKVVITKEGETDPFVYISGNTQGKDNKDTVTLAKGFWFDMASTYQAQVILNEGTGVEIRSDPITLAFAQIYIEKQDPAFPDSKLRWNDFYPALGGGKTIVIRGQDTQGNLLNTKKVKAQVEYPAIDKVKVEPVSGTKFVDGRVAFKLSAVAGQDIAPSSATIPAGIDFVKVRFDILSDNDIKEGEFFGFWNVKNNSNITLEEVLNGEAVFVYDESTAENHVGKTESIVTEDGQRRFDFVQELLNQVVSRKRSVGDANYTLIDESGVFNSATKAAIELFKQHFNVNNDTINESKNSFNKLKKDYGLTEKDKIVDKETLVGVTKSDADVLINGTSGSSGDAGLYELYENVVKAFVRKMIAEAERYSNDTTAFKDRGGALRNGVSYSYGSNDNLSQYQDAATNRTYAPYPYPTGEPYDSYRGNVGQVDPGKQYAGLRDTEKAIWDTQFLTANCDQITNHKFYPQYWAGIDCSGFIQRVINAADPALNPNNGMPPVTIWDVPNLEEYKVVCLGPGANNRDLKNRTWVSYFFDYFSDSRRATRYIVLPDSGTERERLLKLIKKGDLIRYDDIHISMVYSERWGVSNKGTDYDIIHAYGSSTYFDRIMNKYVFSREVIITGNDLPSQGGGILQPTGFGRLKLWN
jgi:hypothetical protein